MQNLYKEIRLRAKMNQEQFANALGTTVLSINRWENDKAQPSKMAQKQLYQFCREHGMDVAAMFIRQRTLDASDGRLILYHGSKSGIVGEIAPISRRACDFGQGFYMGTNVLQPLTLVCAESKPVLYTVELDLTGLKVLHLDIDLDWAMLIAYYRREMELAAGTPVYEKYANFASDYDVIVGYIANDRMFNALTQFFDGTLTDTALLKCLSALDLGKQYVAVTEKACRQIKVLREEALQPLALSALQELSMARRKEGVALAKEIELQYRREGRYFDELLRGEPNA